MARIRTIKPEFWQDEDLALLDAEARLLAIGLLNHSDDHGYFKAHPALVKSAVFPFTDNSLNIHGLLKQLENVQFITLFEGSDRKQYGHIRTFTTNQKVNRPQPSKIKPFRVITERSLNDHGGFTVGKEQGKEQGTGKGTGNREQGKEVKSDDDFDEPETDPNFFKPEETNVVKIPKPDHPIWSWQPAKNILEELIDRFHIPDKFVQEILSEFRAYWAGRQDGGPNYDAKFMGNVQSNWKRSGHNWQPSPEYQEKPKSIADYGGFTYDDDEPKEQAE